MTHDREVRAGKRSDRVDVQLTHFIIGHKIWDVLDSPPLKFNELRIDDTVYCVCIYIQIRFRSRINVST